MEREQVVPIKRRRSELKRVSTSLALLKVCVKSWVIRNGLKDSSRKQKIVKIERFTKRPGKTKFALRKNRRQNLREKNDTDGYGSYVTDQKLPALRPGKSKLIFMFFNFYMCIIGSPDPAYKDRR